jgi:hypothetical protein
VGSLDMVPHIPTDGTSEREPCEWCPLIEGLEGLDIRLTASPKGSTVTCVHAVPTGRSASAAIVLRPPSDGD